MEEDWIDKLCLKTGVEFSREQLGAAFYRNVEPYQPLSGLCNMCRLGWVTVYSSPMCVSKNCRGGCGSQIGHDMIYCQECSKKDDLCQHCGNNTKVYWITFECS
jgi:hypothetical protein